MNERVLRALAARYLVVPESQRGVAWRELGRVIERRGGLVRARLYWPTIVLDTNAQLARLAARKDAVKR